MNELKNKFTELEKEAINCKNETECYIIGKKYGEKEASNIFKIDNMELLSLSNIQNSTNIISFANSLHSIINFFNSFINFKYISFIFWICFLYSFKYFKISFIYISRFIRK